MTPLERALRDRIKAEGSIGVDAFMEACNNYYYATRDPFGSAGDFTTAPEISQMFGEMIGAALADSWVRAGSPQDALYAELGPGRGTLAADALRAMRPAGFSGEVHFVETSPVLREAQRRNAAQAHWHERIEDLPDRPLLLIANEFLDALPVSQHVAGVERRVVVKAGGLAFDRDGEILELSPAREHAVRMISKRLKQNGGVALIIDYGHGRSAPGETLQAVGGHRFRGIFDRPGEQDLTAHVDFQIIAEAARDVGVQVTALVPQGEWLRRLGIEVRAHSLARSNPDHQDEIHAALQRLTATDQMGQTFKVIGLHSHDWEPPAGFA